MSPLVHYTPWGMCNGYNCIHCSFGTSPWVKNLSWLSPILSSIPSPKTNPAVLTILNPDSVWLIWLGLNPLGEMLWVVALQQEKSASMHAKFICFCSPMGQNSGNSLPQTHHWYTLNRLVLFLQCIYLLHSLFGVRYQKGSIYCEELCLSFLWCWSAKIERIHSDGSCTAEEEGNKWFPSMVQANTHIAGLTWRKLQHCHDC